MKISTVGKILQESDDELLQTSGEWWTYKCTHRIDAIKMLCKRVGPLVNMKLWMSKVWQLSSCKRMSCGTWMNSSSLCYFHKTCPEWKPIYTDESKISGGFPWDKNICLCALIQKAFWNFLYKKSNKFHFQQHEAYNILANTHQSFTIRWWLIITVNNKLCIQSDLVLATKLLKY